MSDSKKNWRTIRRTSGLALQPHAAIDEPSYPVAEKQPCPECESLRKENERLRAELQQVADDLSDRIDMTRVCNNPSCTSPVICRDDGTYYCAAGHSPRWMEISEHEKAMEQLRKELEEKLCAK